MQTTTRTHRTHRTARTAAIALLALGALAGTACSSDGEDTAKADERPAASKAEDGTSSTDGAEDEADGDDGAEATAEPVEAATGTPTGPGAPTPPAGTPSAPPAGGGGSSGGGGGAPTPPATPAPTITSFVTPESIDCHNGDFQQFTATFSTSGAVKTTISIDGPGIYAEYGPSGSADLPFNCSSPHTFLLTAHGSDGQTATRQVTLHPRNAQTSAPEDVSDV